MINKMTKNQQNELKFNKNGLKRLKISKNDVEMT